MGAMKKTPTIPQVPHMRDKGGAGDHLLTGGIRADDPTVAPPLPVPRREGNGRFKRGAPSPNPSGRPPVDPDLRDVARTHTTEMLGVLVRMALNEEAPHAARVSAATAVLDRGHGKPVASVEAKVAVADVTAMHLAALEALSRGPMALDHEEAPTGEA